MERRTVNFNEHAIHIVHDEHTDYVALKPVVEALGLKWTNEYQRAKDKFDTHPLVLNLTGTRFSSTLGINYGELETYLHSFKNRQGNFKPPNGFWHKLKECIEFLPNEIFITSPSFQAEMETIESETKVEPEPEQYSPEEESHVDIIQNQESEIEPEPEPEKIDSEMVSQNVAKQVQHEVNPILENNSFTAFVVGDNLKQNIDEVMESLDLVIDSLTEFKDNLNQLREAQFVLLENKTKN